MMPYASAGAFRRALEDRLRNQSRQTGIALAWLRKMVAFERLMARLAKALHTLESEMPRLGAPRVRFGGDSRTVPMQ